MTAIEMMEREVGQSYTTPAERAAYRAGMSTAVAIVDELAAIERKKRSKRGTALSSSIMRAMLLSDASDAIWNARERVHVPEPTT